MVDKISALPEHLLHHIMSFLSFPQAAQTSLLSKTWKQIWFTFPVLEFHDSRSYEIHFFMRRQKFERTLQHRHRHPEMISLTKFTIATCSDEYLTFVSKCVWYAIKSNVKELTLHLALLENHYILPRMVLYSKSINVLELSGCDLELKGKDNVKIKLPSLRKLCLKHVKLRGDDCHELIENLVAGCPSIEYLSIASCRLKNIELFGLDKLQEVEVMRIDELQRLEIKASCKNIKHLKLSSISIITDQWLYNQIRNLPLLDYLNISGLDQLQRIDISSPRLKTLIIGGCCNLVEAKIETPSLCIFKYKGQMISFSSNRLALSEVDLYVEFNYRGMQKEIWYYRYIKLLENFNHGVVNLGSCNVEVVNIPESLRKAIPSPLSSNVKHLNFTLDTRRYKNFSIFPIMDGLLWIAPHVETMVFNYPCYISRVKRKIIIKYCFQFSYHEEGIVGCCKSLPVACWCHCIKEVKVEIHNELKKGDGVKRYSLQGEEIIKKLNSIHISGNRST